jgi:hypothetical protein
MKLSELIKQLQEIEKKHGGDKEIYIYATEVEDVVCRPVTHITNHTDKILFMGQKIHCD